MSEEYSMIERSKAVWGIPARLLAAAAGPQIDHEPISESYGISKDGIAAIVDRLRRMLRGQAVTNGRVLAYMLGVELRTGGYGDLLVFMVLVEGEQV
jgi:hypothetical protein